MNRYGRPQLDDDTRLSDRVQIPLTRRLRRQLEEEARRANYKALAPYIREKVLEPRASQ